MPGWPLIAGNQRQIMPDPAKKRRQARWRHARIHRQYTIEEAARATGTCRATVRRWHEKGLPYVEERRPYLILGRDLVDFLKRQPKRQPCQLDECYCMSCREPRKTLGRIADYVRFTPARGNLVALCEGCETLMHKAMSSAQLAALKGILDVSIMDRNLRIDSRG